ncbi:hypothetical protein H696_01992 [Fonticula alba]|uniref:Uncharacterized protein n=1 Tax=Fonticula alba TaxID=691883 RepID=A0A058ZAU5_FONAL|nr:hypothetical protein H696_01992 [Fonticula alba]KCV71043.1 hypothetical protein H696_01992 [Fonticula alba]|eukprot:XP_009494166.1 hypothetical protein H696_01992 [Fonticula alba]
MGVIRNFFNLPPRTRRNIGIGVGMIASLGLAIDSYVEEASGNRELGQEQVRMQMKLKEQREAIMEQMNAANSAQPAGEKTK